MHKKFSPGIWMLCRNLNREIRIHRNFKGFDRIESCVPKTHTGIFLVGKESFKNPSYFLCSKGGLRLVSSTYVTTSPVVIGSGCEHEALMHL
jgi:hypothetical protein